MSTANRNRLNVNLTNTDSFPGAILGSFSQMLKETQTMIPAKIIKYDRNSNRAQVQLMLNILGTGGDQTPNAQVNNVPVVLLGGGDFFISYDLAPGDLGFLLATDRDCSLFFQTYEAAAPGVQLIRNFSSSVFIPSVMNNYTISEEDSGKALIQNKSGTVKISLSQDTITLKAPNVVIESSTGVTITTPLLYVDGNIAASGTITPEAPPP